MIVNIKGPSKILKKVKKVEKSRKIDNSASQNKVTLKKAENSPIGLFTARKLFINLVGPVYGPSKILKKSEKSEKN